MLEQLLAADRGHLHDLARSSSSYCTTGKRNGLPRGWRTATTATSTASSGRPANTPSRVVKKDEIDSALGYFENKIFTLFEGTSEIQRMLIGRTVTGLDVR